MLLIAGECIISRALSADIEFVLLAKRLRRWHDIVNTNLTDGIFRKRGAVMQIHQSAEDYLEMILMLTERLGYARSVDIANELNVTKPSVSVAMKRLRENDYIKMDSSGLITLTEAGQKIADRVYDRHKVLTAFFHDLGVDETIAEKDACEVEHVISEETFEAICRFVHRLL